MKSFFLVTLLNLVLVAAVPSTTFAHMDEEELDTDESVLSPEQEQLFYEQLEILKDGGFRFQQSTWKECADEITGNFYGYNCASRRGISAILLKFMNTHMYQCIDAGLAAQGGGRVSELHVVHAGILGDRRHSPRSLHAENRAIDIKSFDMKLTNGQVKEFVFEKSAHRPFFKAFRKCWGQVVNKYNGCPYYKGTPGLTATIGWEDKNHQHHMHTSVPYCVGGSYGGYYYQK